MYFPTRLLRPTRLYLIIIVRTQKVSLLSFNELQKVNSPRGVRLSGFEPNE